ncbi:MAG TPA: hypothetical protein VE860_00895, partial [Chthoniobacterales bacterium]|nr:hypothetical protein [Chthoniobacterales bacterium]
TGTSAVPRCTCLGTRHFEAAERLRATFERASGAQPGKGRPVYDGMMPTPITRPGDPNARQLTAMRHRVSTFW